jgi:3-hydroxyisobutyrate dehydrogenase
MKIGIAGTGRMGAAVAARLLDLGHEITVWNRTPGKTAALEAAGAKAAPTPAALAAAAETVITILTDAPAVQAVYAGLLSAQVGGKLFIDMSTVRPEIERRLASEVKARGAAFVECPVGGSVAPARDGKLFGFAGAEPADFERAKPLLAQMCRRIEHVGAPGAGAAMKLAINLPLLVFWQSFGEALSICEPLGIDPARLMDIFADTSGGPNLLKARGAALAGALSGKAPGPASFTVDSIRKDLRTMIEEGRALGADLPVTALALACFDEASKEGLGAKDASALPARLVRR